MTSTNAVAFISDKEKGLIFVDGAAQGCAKLVCQIGELRRVEKSPLRQRHRPEEFVLLPVEINFVPDLVTTFDTARVAPIFRVKSVSQDAKLRDASGEG